LLIGSGYGFLIFSRTLAVCLLVCCSALAESSADLYKAHCAACHGTHGTGDTMLGRNLKLRPLDSDEVQKQSDEELATAISKGKGKNRMPAFEHKLNKEQIADLVRYIRALRK
jgi:mono/diheme cytochrome c family protein